VLEIELIFDGSCPNVEAARAQLKRALDRAGLDQNWKEWNLTESTAPSYAFGYGSPTILVNGLDVAGERPAESTACCRLYEDKAGKLKGVPPFEVIVDALLQGAKRQ
jgi:mercuric ion transport protein